MKTLFSIKASRLEKCIFFLSVLLLSSCVSRNNADAINDKQEVNLISNELADSLTMQLNAIEKSSVIPGFAAAIIHKDKVIYQKGFGYSDVKNDLPYTPQTVNFVASVSKTFIGLAIMKLVENNQLQLDEKINDILPYKVINPHFPDVPITVRHLVNHTSTLTDDFDPEDTGDADVFLLEDIKYENDSIQAFMDEELAYYKLGKEMTLDEVLQNFLTKKGKWYSKTNFENYPPGTKYEYSNIGSELAGRIVGIKSGMPFNEFTKKHIFQPLKMNNTGWFYESINPKMVSKIYLPDSWDKPTIAIEHPKYKYAAYPSGELKTNIEDWNKYLIEMIKGYAGNGSLLKKESYQMLFNPMLDDTYFGEEREASALSDEYNVGVFWAVSPTGLRLHNGGSIGVYAFMYFNPETESGAIGFCNLPDGSFGKIRDVVYEYENRMNAN